MDRRKENSEMNQTNLFDDEYSSNERSFQSSGSEEQVLFDGKNQNNTFSEKSESVLSKNESKHLQNKEPEEEKKIIDDIPKIKEKCDYCEISHPHELAQCLECNTWLCNTKIGQSASHIIFHMVKRKHKSIKLHKLSKLGDLQFECFFCQKKNIFNLGLVPYIVNDQKTFITCCRKFYCASKSTVSQFNINQSEWQSLIQDKQILDFLISCSEKSKQINQELDLKIKYLTRYENKKMNQKEFKMEDHGGYYPDQLGRQEIKKIPLVWPGEEAYYQDFMRLVQLEMQEDQRQKESVFFSNLELDWKKATFKKKKVFVTCKLPIFEEVDINAFTNQTVSLSLPMEGPLKFGLVISYI